MPDLIHLLRSINTLNNQSLVVHVLIYILDQAPLQEEAAFIQLIKTQLSEEIGEKIMTLSQNIYSKGRLNGIEEGERTEKLKTAKRLLEAGQTDLNFIAQITGLSVAELQSLLSI